ncbi:MAG TPA: peptidylprolyl isomerase [Gaiellaceae bacterium]|nr:peptidylprolyl isomerase [Gaiellaceae bacterium]
MTSPRAKAALAALIGLAVFGLAGCGGGAKRAAKTSCPTSGKQVTFPLLDKSKAYMVDVHTNFGDFDIRLDVKNSPCTTSSFAALVRKGFFDGTRFHRIVPGFVIQGGDPTGTGQGGPGYTVRDVPPGNAAYTKGVVAMAKTSAEPAGTSGSQFFVVTGANAGLPAQYALLGVVTKGLPVVDRIGKLGNPVSERPTRKVVVLKMIVTP